MPQYVNRNRPRKRKLKSSAIALMTIALLLIAAIIATVIVITTPESNNVSSNNASDTQTSNIGGSTTSNNSSDGSSGNNSDSSSNNGDSSSDGSGSNDSDSSNNSSTPSYSNPSSNNNSTNSTTSTTIPPAEQTPLGGNYLNVGTDYVCEIVNWEGETFTATSKNYISKPTNTPLPVGTVDYCSGTFTDNGLSSSSSEYKISATLRCGLKVFTESLHIERSKVYKTSEYGKLPDTNNVTILSGGVTSDKRYSTVKLDVDWKAPFTVAVGPQAYANPSDDVRNFSISAPTYSYIDITFCYASKNITNDIAKIDFTNSIFSRAEWKKNKSDYTLRLYLKKVGGAYGWFAEYDSNDNLVFYFLNPAVITINNGVADLSNVNVFLDVGHGGVDSGAIGKLNGTTYYESHMNLKLANAVKKELEAMGATVTLSRTTDVQLRSVDVMQKIRDSRADIAINIHHDSGGSRGCGVFYYNPTSFLAANSIKNSISSINLYSKTYLNWHVYYGARVMHCPVVLTENGFMDSAADLAIITSDAQNQKRAKAIADGIVDYFKKINGLS